MNLLIDSVPNCIYVKGKRYSIRTDFRIWIMFEQLLLDNSINDNYKLDAAVKLVFDNNAGKPHINDDIVQAILNFYNFGRTVENGKGKSSDRNSKIYDYDADDEYIYAAFLQQYGIDLQQVQSLHWWQFKALFCGLTDSCKFVEIMGYRAVNLEDVSKSQRPFYRKMKKLYALPVSADELAKTNKIEEALLAGKGVNGLL